MHAFDLDSSIRSGIIGTAPTLQVRKLSRREVQVTKEGLEVHSVNSF